MRNRVRPCRPLLVRALLVLGLAGCSSGAPSSPAPASIPVAISATGAGPGEEVLPAAVADAAAAAVPGGRLVAAAREEERGETIYEVLVATDAGDFDVDLTLDGRVLEIDPAAGAEREISPADLPPAVRAAAEAEVPGGRITQAVRKVVRDDVVYDVEIDVRGRKFDLEIDAEGTVREIDEGN